MTPDNDLRQQILSKLSHAGDASSTNHNNNDKADTVQELLKISESALIRILDPLLTIVECRRLMMRVHGACAVQPCSALQVIRSTNNNRIGDGEQQQQQQHSPRQFSGKISTGLSTIDNYLFGGFATRSITEVVGRAGVGKTHLAQQLCVLAATTSGGGAIFIDTENKLSLSRLNEIAMNRSRREKASTTITTNSSGGSGGMDPNDIAQHVLENVTVRSLLSTKELLETIDELGLEITQRNTEAETQSRLPVRLLVIDSIAAPIRRDFDMISSSSFGSSSSAAQRAAALLQIGQKLKQLASDFNLAVVVINQVGVGGNSNNHQGDYKRNDTLDIRDGEFTASLGTAWQYCVSTKIILEHYEDPHKQGQHQNGNVSATRTATIAKSLLSRRAMVEFQVTDEGLCEISS